MPSKKTAPGTPLVKEYVRCRDLDGELWTIPRGSALHLEAWADVQQGHPDQYIPIELIREPWRGLEWEAAAVLPSYVRLAETQAERIKVWRLGQFVRLQVRAKARRAGQHA